MKLLIDLFQTVVGFIAFLHVLGQVAFGKLVWPTEEEMLESLKPDVWECAHHVQGCIAERRRIEPERIQLELLDWLLLRMERKGFVRVGFVPEPDCPHDPPCGEYFYMLTEGGQTRLKKLSRAPTTLTPEPLPA